MRNLQLEGLATPTAASQAGNWLASLILQHSREYGMTFATEFSLLACQLLTYKLSAHLLGTLAFAEYALAKRTVSLIYPIPLLGLAVALPRFVAQASGADDQSRSEEYFAAAVWCVGSALLVSLILINSFAGGFAYLFFGDRQYQGLVLPLSVWLCGLALHAVAYGYFRGHLAMTKANLLQMVNLGLVPLGVFMFFRRSAGQYLMGLGLATVLVAGTSLAFLPLRRLDATVRRKARELLQYGLQRVPGEFLQMALFTLPATLAAHLSGIKAAGYIALATSILTMIGSMFAPLGLILLPKASRMLAAGARKELRSHTIDIMWLTVLVSTGLAVLVEFSAGWLIRGYLGPSFADAVPIVRLMVVAALPFSFYCVTRNLVDAFHANAVNARNLLVTFTVFGLASVASRFISSSPAGVLYAFLLAMFLLAFLTGRETARILRVDRVMR